MLSLCFPLRAFRRVIHHLFAVNLICFAPADTGSFVVLLSPCYGHFGRSKADTASMRAVKIPSPSRHWCTSMPSCQPPHSAPAPGIMLTLSPVLGTPPTFTGSPATHLLSPTRHTWPSPLSCPCVVADSNMRLIIRRHCPTMKS
jgi:hypothetical protein